MTLDDLQSLTEYSRTIEDGLRSDYPEYSPLIKLELTSTGLEIRCGAWSESASYDKTVLVTWCQLHGDACRCDPKQQIRHVADMMRVRLRKHGGYAS